jgi:hypothetical protein
MLARHPRWKMELVTAKIPPLLLAGTQLIAMTQFFHGRWFQRLLHRDIPAEDGSRRANFRH